MISNKTDGVVQLFQSQNVAIIKELFDRSFFTDDIFMSSLRACFTKYSRLDSQFIVEIMNLISDNFGDEVLKQDKFVLNNLITQISPKTFNIF